MKNAKIAIILAAVAAIAIVAAVRVQIVSAFQDDACQMISTMIAEKVGDGALFNQELANATISQLIRASVINARIDRDGNPTDYNGNPFQIDVGEGIIVTSTRRSALHPFRSQATVVMGD